MRNPNMEVHMQVATVTVGRNAVEVEIIGKTESGYRVRSRKSGKEFTVAKLEPQAPKRLSLLEAAIQALQAQPAGTALNTRELVELATASDLWANNGAKTPEQTLYSAIFREIAAKGRPRIIRSTQRGKFELNREA